MLLAFYKKYLRYNPQDRDLSGAVAWIQEIQKLTKHDGDCALLYERTGLQKLPSPLSPAHLIELLNIITLMPQSNKLAQFDTHTIFFEGNFKDDDSIHNSAVRTLIFTGLNASEDSKDTVHDLSHVIRVTRLAKLFFNEMKKDYPALDWGTIATAITWHDISRSDHMGFFYDKSTPLRRKLRTLTPFLDAAIAWYNKHDALRSCVHFYKEAKANLPKDLHHRIAIAILGEHSFNALEERLYPGVVTYKNIVFWADTLDIITLARWFGAYYECLVNKKHDLRLLNRYLVLNALFNLPRMNKQFVHPVVKPFFDMVVAVSLNAFRKFVPTDAELLEQALFSKPKKR